MSLQRWEIVLASIFAGLGLIAVVWTDVGYVGFPLVAIGGGLGIHWGWQEYKQRLVQQVRAEHATPTTVEADGLSQEGGGTVFAPTLNPFTSSEPVSLWIEIFRSDFFWHRTDRDARLRYGDQPDDIPGYLELNIVASITALPGALLETIDLQILERLIPSDWEAREVSSSNQVDLYFKVPDWVNLGKHEARLIALYDGGLKRVSRPRIVKFPKP